MVAVHNERQMTERRYYYEKRDKAKHQPKRFLSLIIDGMDQAKTNLPHFTGRLLKGVDPNSFLKTHIQGVLNHGCGTFKCFVDINEYSHDSNLVINSLLCAIHEAKLKLGTLPEVLYIQADNCARENKNKYVLSFCELLIHLQIFKEVHLSFLPVGHTHEDIDAQFSNLADILRRNDAETLTTLLHLLPNAVLTQGLYDVKTWLESHLNYVAYHSKPLHFKFSKFNDEILVQYKTSCRKDWVSSDSCLLLDLPSGTPNILHPPHFGKINIKSLRDNISKYKYQMTDRQFWWWQHFMAEIEDIQTNKNSLERYAANGAEWLLPSLTSRNSKQISQENECSLKPYLTEMLDKELDDYKMTVVKRSVKK